MSEQSRQLERRNKLLDALAQAEEEWGTKLETQIEKEAAFFKNILSTRVGAGAATNRIRDRLTDLTVDKISELLTG